MRMKTIVGCMGFALFLSFVPVFSAAQVPSVRPEATILVTEQPNGVEQLDITMLNTKFPKAFLEGISMELGRELGMQPWGTPWYEQRFGDGRNDKFVKGRIMVNGITDTAIGTVNLQAVARAFAGVPKPFELGAIRLVLPGFQPTAATVRDFSSTKVAVAGDIDPSTGELAYLIVYKDQDPKSIAIPVRHEAKVPAPEIVRTNAPVSPLLYGLIAVASVAAGCLVYFLVANRGRTQPK